MVRKKFINSVDSTVDDCLNGVILADSHLTYHPVSFELIVLHTFVFIGESQSYFASRFESHQTAWLCRHSSWGWNWA